MELDILSAWQTTTSSTSIQIDSLSKAWIDLNRFIDPTNNNNKLESPSFQLLQQVKLLQQAAMMDQLLLDYLDALRNNFNLIEDQISTHLHRIQEMDDNPEEGEEERRFNLMISLLDSIGQSIKRWQQPITLFWPTSNSLSCYRKTFLSSLYYILPPSFSTSVQSFLRTLLTLPTPTPTSPQYPLAFPTLITLLDRFDPLLFALIYEEIEKRTKLSCRGKFETRELEGLLKWLNGGGNGQGGGGGGILGWVSGIYEGGLTSNPSTSISRTTTINEGSSAVGIGNSVTTTTNATNEEAKKFLKPTFSRFEYHIHKVLCQLRTTEMFDLILNYPLSKPALEDLKLCLIKTDQRSLLVHRLRQQLELRLLHPGTETKQVITLYVSSIRCLRIIDPPGVLLSRVANPIRRYLRGRKDTIRCIVSSLIEEGNPLFQELTMMSDAKLVSGSGVGVTSSQDSKEEAENYTDQKWMPDPVDAPPDFRKSKGADVIQLLVSIYDSKEVFVKELQVLLAQRLLVIRDYSFDKEIENVTILKGRFGEQSLQGCEVMLKDLQDSQRIDQAVHSATPSIPLHATVVSRLFWPSFQPAPLKLPGQLGRVQSDYDRTFSSLKADKKLRWLPQLGNVNLTIQLKDRSLTVDATPVQAAIIEMFTKQDTWAPDALQVELKLTDLATVRNGLFFWNNLGVVKSTTGTSSSSSVGDSDLWTLIEEQTEGGGVETDQVAHVIEEEKEAVQSVEAQGVDQMRVFWQFIQGMLTNLGALPIARIHQTLNMLAPGYKGKTTDELKALLEAVEAEGLVRKTPSGSWKIVK